MAKIELSRKFPLRKGYCSRALNEEREAQYAFIWGRAPQVDTARSQCREVKTLTFLHCSRHRKRLGLLYRGYIVEPFLDFCMYFFLITKYPILGNAKTYII